MDIGIGTLYIIGIPIAILMALLWSFVFDKQKPPTTKEFVLKLLARAMLFIVMLAVVIGVLSLALPGPPPA